MNDKGERMPTLSARCPTCREVAKTFEVRPVWAATTKVDHHIVRYEPCGHEQQVSHTGFFAVDSSVTS